MGAGWGGGWDLSGFLLSILRYRKSKEKRSQNSDREKEMKRQIYALGLQHEGPLWGLL